MIRYFVPLFSSFLNSGIWDWLTPIFILFLIATVPCIVRTICDFRR